MSYIETLLPHRHPFLFLDEIISANMDEIVGIKTFDDSFEAFQGHFPERRIVPGIILVETMAQCGGAGLKQLGIVGEGVYGFATMEKVRFLSLVEFGQTVKMVVKNLRVSGRVIKQSGIAYCEDKAVAEAMWICARL